MGQTVSCYLVREFFRSLTLKAVFKVIPSGYTCSGNSLVCRVNYTFDFVFVIKGLKDSYSLDCRTVGICYNSAVPRNILGVAFGNNKGNLGVLSPLG